MHSAIAVINYECPHFLGKQLPLIRKYLRPSEIYVYDTSREEDASYQNELICIEHMAHYRRLHIEDGDNSIHHATALNIAYEELRPQFDAVGFLDHDCFPFAEFPVWETMETNTFMAIGQAANYPHPGYLFINTAKAGFLNFLPCEGKDTGGRIALRDCHTMSYHYYDNPQHEVIGGFLMHFIKGSNWHGEEPHLHHERIQELGHKLTEYECANL